MVDGGHTVSLRTELEKQHKAAFSWALHCCFGETQQAEDALQDTYLKILSGKAVYKGKSTMKTWLFGVIRRTASEHRRRHLLSRLHLFSDIDSNYIDDKNKDPAVLADERKLQDQFFKVLYLLPKRQREITHLVFAQEMTIQEAATIMNVSIGSARRHYARGKLRLKDLLTNLEPS